jgi:hypothetical protein
VKCDVGLHVSLRGAMSPTPSTPSHEASGGVVRTILVERHGQVGEGGVEALEAQASKTALPVPRLPEEGR